MARSIHPTGIVLIEEGHPQSGIAYVQEEDGSWSVQTSYEVWIMEQGGRQWWVPWPPPANDPVKATWRWESLRDLLDAVRYSTFLIRARPHELRAYHRMLLVVALHAPEPRWTSQEWMVRRGR